jgi:hypothetical protein
MASSASFAHVVAATVIFVLLGERTVGKLGKRHVLQAQSPLLVVLAGGLDVASCGLLLQAFEGLRDRKLDRQREERVDDAGPRAVRPILDGDHRGLALARRAAEHDPVAFEANRIVGKVGVEQGIEPASSHRLRCGGRRNEILQRGPQAIAFERRGPELRHRPENARSSILQPLRVPAKFVREEILQPRFGECRGEGTGESSHYSTAVGDLASDPFQERTPRMPIGERERHQVQVRELRSGGHLVAPGAINGRGELVGEPARRVFRRSAPDGTCPHCDPGIEESQGLLKLRRHGIDLLFQQPVHVRAAVFVEDREIEILGAENTRKDFLLPRNVFGRGSGAAAWASSSSFQSQAR